MVSLPILANAKKGQHDGQQSSLVINELLGKSSRLACDACHTAEILSVWHKRVRLAAVEAKTRKALGDIREPCVPRTSRDLRSNAQDPLGELALA